VTNPLTILANGLRLLKAVWLVWRHCRGEQAGIVLSTNDPSHFYCGPAARLAGAKSVWWLSNMIPRDQAFGMIYSLFNLFRRLFCDRVICISQAVKDSLKSQANAGVVWYPTRELPDSFPNRKQCLEQHGLERLQDHPLVGMACRLVLWKGVQVLIEAAPAVLAEFPQARFLILGDSPHEDQKRVLRDRIAALGLNEAFILHGFVEHPLELINCLDVCVHASVVPEPFGLTVLDYMQLGKAIVAAREGGIGEMLDGGSAVMVDSGDPAALAGGICRLLGSSQLRSEMGEAARRRASGFAPAVFVEKMIRQLRQAVDSCPKSSACEQKDKE
jgi:glycosyltransferase involved in cell wall biosynthesis